MKIHEIFEARRNPALNPKLSINQQIAAQFDQTSEKIAGVRNLFVSFTKLDKLGINPKSKYDTPLGIYAYPAEYVVDRAQGRLSMDAALPFAGDQPYANTFSVTGNIINLVTMTYQEEQEIYEKLYSVLPEFPYINNRIFDDIVNNAFDNARFPLLPGGRAWYVTYTLSQEVNYSKSSTAWNKIFRLLGIDGCVDTGQGIIHPNEPVQAVFFAISAIKNIKRLQNRYSPDELERREDNRSYLIKKAGEIDTLTDPIAAAKVVNWIGGEVIKYMKNKRLRNDMLLFQPSLSNFMVTPIPFEIQEKILTADISNLHYISKIDQKALYNALLKNMNEIGSYLISEIRQKIPNLSPEIKKLFAQVKGVYL